MLKNLNDDQGVKMEKKVYRLFSDIDLSKLLESEEKIFKRKINKVNNKRINNKGEILKSYYIDHYFKPLQINLENIQKTQYVDKKLHMLFYVYCIPFEGDAELLRYNPSDGITGWTLKVYTRPGYICFEKETYIHNPADFEEEIDEIKEVIKKEVEKINRDLKKYNESLRKYIEQVK